MAVGINLILEGETMETKYGERKPPGGFPMGRAYPNTHTKDPEHLSDSGKNPRRVKTMDHGKHGNTMKASVGYHASKNSPATMPGHSYMTPMDERSTDRHLKPAGQKDKKLGPGKMSY